MMLTAQRIAPEQKLVDGTIMKPTGYVQFRDHFLRSDHAVQDLRDMGHETITEKRVLEFLRNSQPFKNGRFFEVTEEQIAKFNHAKAQIFNLADPGGGSVSEDAVTAAQEGMTPTEATA
jgi:hypothetical protein